MPGSADSRRFARLCACLLLLGTAAASRADPAAVLRNGLHNGLQEAEALRNEWSSNLVNSVEWFDRFFSDERIQEERNHTRVRVGLGFKTSTADPLSAVTEFSARIDLPRLEQRLQLVFDDMLETEEFLNLKGVREAAEDSMPQAGALYVFQPNEKFRLSAGAGLRVANPVQLYGKLRGSVALPLERSEWYLAQQVQYYTHDRLGTTTEARWDRPLRYGWLFRATSRLDWRSSDAGFTPSQGLALLRQIGERRAYRVDVTGTWPEAPNVTESSYALAGAYRQLIYRDWLFLEVSPSVTFPEIGGYDPIPALKAKLDVVFCR
jgi:hypothetical protein